MMKRTILCLSIAAFAVPAFAGSVEERNALNETVRKFSEESSARMAQMTEEAKTLEAKALSLGKKLGTGDAQTNAKADAQLKELVERRNKAYIAIAEYAIEIAQKNAEFAEERVELAEKNLEEVKENFERFGTQLQPPSRPANTNAAPNAPVALSPET